jgi:N-formylglutamate amidohydrolase
MILHIPHTTRTISSEYRGYFVLDDSALEKELIKMVDSYTDELFSSDTAQAIIFPYPRLLVDVERFSDDAHEPMSNVGMGMIYKLTADGKPLKRDLSDNERLGLKNLYEEHHKELNNLVAAEITNNNKVMIVDCHSFPSQPLPCDISQQQPRPDFCIGTDEFHTPKDLVKVIEAEIKKHGYSININEPYSGTLVPMDYYQKDANVHSIMIEVNRELYMNEVTGDKNDRFVEIKSIIDSLLSTIKSYV